MHLFISRLRHIYNNEAIFLHSFLQVYYLLLVLLLNLTNGVLVLHH